MSGYDPMEELSVSLDSLERASSRRITVTPPPTDDFTTDIERPTADTESRSEPDVLSDEEGAGDVMEEEPATVALPTRRRGRGLAIRRPNGPMKAVTASLPAQLVDRVTELRLDAEVAGRSFKLTELFSAALLELPLKPTSVSALIDRYSAQLNFDRSSKDEGFLPERRLSTQITPDAAQRVATIVRAVYQDFGVKVSNKDLYAVALLNFLADRN